MQHHAAQNILSAVLVKNLPLESREGHANKLMCWAQFLPVEPGSDEHITLVIPAILCQPASESNCVLSAVMFVMGNALEICFTAHVSVASDAVYMLCCAL